MTSAFCVQTNLKERVHICLYEKTSTIKVVMMKKMPINGYFKIYLFEILKILGKEKKIMYLYLH